MRGWPTQGTMAVRERQGEMAVWWPPRENGLKAVVKFLSDTVRVSVAVEGSGRD